jgi:hypothetical protein
MSRGPPSYFSSRSDHGDMAPYGSRYCTPWLREVVLGREWDGSSLRATRFGIGGMTRTPSVYTISRVKQGTSTLHLLFHYMQINQTAGHNLDWMCHMRSSVIFALFEMLPYLQFTAWYHPPRAPQLRHPLQIFWSVVKGWGNTWIWDNLTIKGDVSWLAESIADNFLVAVTDGSYMKDTYPQLNLAAFIFECTKGRGCLWGSFVEHTPDAGSC